MSWSKKYKKSIDCSNPKGFSQKAHCAGRKARKRGDKTVSKSVNERKMKITEENQKFFNSVKEKWGLTNEGILSFIFKRKLKKALDNNKELQKAIKDGDKALEDLGIEVKKLRDMGYKIPPELQVYLK